MNPRYPRRGVYVLPNLFTTASLFAGFYSIVASIHGHYRTAAIVIFIAMILDGLDGRVARMTHTESAFGAEYDSLADVIAFGLAPAILVLLWGLQNFGNSAGWVLLFIRLVGPCVWRVSIPRCTALQNATFRACRSPLRQPFWPVWSGWLLARGIPG
jgi:Phosphatidylserine synthase